MTAVVWLLAAAALTTGTLAGWRLRHAWDRAGHDMETLINVTREPACGCMVTRYGDYVPCDQHRQETP